MPKLETVKIELKEAKDGYAIINKADFNEKEHKLYSEKPKAAPKKRKSTAKKAK
jgi:hypothetical protein